MCIVSTQDWKQHNLIMVAGYAFVLPGCSSYCSRILNCLFVCPGVVDDERLWSKSWLDRLPQHPTGSLHCAQCKSHTDQLNNTNAHNKTLQWSLECFVCFSSFFFLMVLLFNVVLPLLSLNYFTLLPIHFFLQYCECVECRTQHSEAVAVFCQRFWMQQKEFRATKNSGKVI